MELKIISRILVKLWRKMGDFKNCYVFVINILVLVFICFVSGLGGLEFGCWLLEWFGEVDLVFLFIVIGLWIGWVEALVLVGMCWILVLGICKVLLIIWCSMLAGVCFVVVSCMLNKLCGVIGGCKLILKI